jgi:hypothetical protein
MSCDLADACFPLQQRLLAPFTHASDRPRAKPSLGRRSLGCRESIQRTPVIKLFARGTVPPQHAVFGDRGWVPVIWVVRWSWGSRDHGAVRILRRNDVCHCCLCPFVCYRPSRIAARVRRCRATIRSSEQSTSPSASYPGDGWPHQSQRDRIPVPDARTSLTLRWSSPGRATR